MTNMLKLCMDAKSLSEGSVDAMDQLYHLLFEIDRDLLDIIRKHPETTDAIAKIRLKFSPTFRFMEM
jgi:succinate dehydrogenase flavin-adding protein (antitoxin of CptAB toxin-antitoxin module)